MAGVLTHRNLFELLPFDNTLVTMTLTGASLEAIVRKGTELDSVEVNGKLSRATEGYRVVASAYLAGGDAGPVGFLSGGDRREAPILLRELMEEDVRRTGEARPSREARIVVIPAAESPGK